MSVVFKDVARHAEALFDTLMRYKSEKGSHVGKGGSDNSSSYVAKGGSGKGFQNAAPKAEDGTWEKGWKRPYESDSSAGAFSFAACVRAVGGGVAFRGQANKFQRTCLFAPACRVSICAVLFVL